MLHLISIILPTKLYAFGVRESQNTLVWSEEPKYEAQWLNDRVITHGLCTQKYLDFDLRSIGSLTIKPQLK